MRIYTCGSIDRAKDGGIGWRRALTSRLAGHTVLDPTAKESQVLAAVAKASLALGDVGNARTAMEKIRSDDLAMLASCDVVFALINPEDRPCGSYFELAYARALGKPTFVTVAGGVTRCPLWLLAEFEIVDDWPF